MKKPFQCTKRSTGRNPLGNDRGDISIFTCFFVVGIVMLISFLLLYASIRITCINIRNGAKMELNNLSTDDYRVRDIRLSFHVTGDRVEYVFTCNVEFYVYMFGHSYPAITRPVELTGCHNTKF